MPHAFSMHFCECLQWSKENSLWNLISCVFSRVDLDLCLWNTENSDFPRILSKNVALQRRAILYVFYEGNCDFGCILYNRTLSLEPWFWISCISYGFLALFVMRNRKHLKIENIFVPKSDHSVSVEWQVLGRVWLGAPATPPLPPTPLGAPQTAILRACLCICVPMYLRICVTAYLCICVAVYL